jgi:YidC/Oxa1 family membrane protein insertase
MNNKLMDKNSIIGFVLLVVLGAVYIFWNNHEQQQFLEQKRTDSIANVALQQKANAQQQAALPKDTATIAQADTSATAINPSAQKAEMVTLSNSDLSIQFSTKGGHPAQAQLSQFKNYNGNALYIFNSDQHNKLSFTLPVGGKTILTDQLFFTPELTTGPEGGKNLRFTAQIAAGQSIELNYSLPAKGYMMQSSVRFIGLQNELAAAQKVPLSWSTEMLHTEKDLTNERMNMQMHYVMQDGDHDYFTISRTPSKTLDEPVKWMSVRSHFFNSTIIAKEAFKTADFNGKEPADTNIVATNTSNFTIPVKASNDFSFDYSWYMGPNDYKILKSYGNNLEEMIQLGFGPFFFVKYISKWMIIPIFDLLSQFITSFGLIIICLTIIIRLITSFFTYKSYLSSAKMKVLKPELDELRAKFGDNQQQMGMEQMKLYRTAGVNPLGGCLPMLLQMPFLLSVYYFIPTAIQLRQSKFLWSEDLSTYDSVLNLGFNIPFYGDHVSLFTLLMTASSLILAVYNRNMTANAAGGNDANMQMMKYMPYIMPIMFLGWFNSMAAGLTFYYTFSNLLSILQQFIIQKFVINEDKIHAQIKENRSKPAATSKWQQRLNEMQQMQAEKMKNKK